LMPFHMKSSVVWENGFPVIIRKPRHSLLTYRYSDWKCVAPTAVSGFKLIASHRQYVPVLVSG
jgi:hypothetical protein